MDDDYGYGRPLGLIRIFLEYGEAILVPFALAMAIVPIVLYLVARSRAKSDPFPDGQVGLKFALAYFKTISFHTMLAGGVILVFALLMKGNDKSPVYRTGFGFLVPATIVYIVHLLAIGRTNHAEHPTVHRMFAGWSLLVSGIVGFAGFMLVAQTLFQKGSSGEPGRFAWALFLVYSSAWIVQAARYFRASTGGAEAELPYYPPPPGAYAGGPPVVPGYAAPMSPFAPPGPAGDAAYAPPPPPDAVYAPAASLASPPPPPPTAPPFPPGSPFAPNAGGDSAPVAAVTEVGPSPFAPPKLGAPPAPPVAAAPPAPTPQPAPSPFAPPGMRGPATPQQPGVVVPAPMAQPLAPPRGGGGGGSGSGGSSGSGT
jgi:hypothetical protein